MSKTHWRKVAGKEYLIGEELDGKDIKVTIEAVKIMEIQNQQGKEKKPVMSFKGSTRKLVLNVTNMKTIAKEVGSSYVEDWAGKEITLTPVQGKFFGVDQEVIRIKQDFSNIKV